MDGSAQIQLKDGESLTVTGLPYGTQWTVTEMAADGFFTECGAGGTESTVSDTVSGTLTEDDTAYFVNIYGRELPSTGTSARFVMVLCGGSMMLLALVCGLGMRRKRERRQR